MRFGFISDVHGDLEALRRALELLDGDQVLCLGDVSGGRESEACLQLMRRHGLAGVAGNHDLWEYELAGFSESSLAYLKARPLELRMADFLAVHSDYTEADKHFCYIHSENDARRAWSRFPDQLIFFGHTHLAQIHWMNGQGRVGFARARSGRCLDGVGLLYEFVLEPACRYLVNVGAAKDGAVVYDSDRRVVRYHFWKPEAARQALEPRPEPEVGSHRG